MPWLKPKTDDLKDPREWKTSKKKPDNIWQIWDGKTLSIFVRNDDLFGWSIANGKNNVEFSEVGFDTREDAVEHLADELEA